MIQLALCRSQTRFDVSQTFSVGQLGKCHAEELIPAGEALDLVVAVVAFYALPEIVDRDEVHQLGEYGTTRVHEPSPSAGMQKYGPLQKIFSNRLQPFLPANPHQTLIYSLLPFKRWDSSASRLFLILSILDLFVGCGVGSSNADSEGDDYSGPTVSGNISIRVAF